MLSVLQDPNATKTKSPFEELFEFVATSDDSAYVCVPAALEFRREICGGEDAIMSYCQQLANDGAEIVAAALGTDVLQEPDLKPGEKSRMRQCAMATVRLPIAVDESGSGSGSETGTGTGAWTTISTEEASRVPAWIQNQLMERFDTFVPVFRHGPWLWTRLSGQIYLEKSDFEWLAGVLRELCEQVKEGV